VSGAEKAWRGLPLQFPRCLLSGRITPGNRNVVRVTKGSEYRYESSWICAYDLRTVLHMRRQRSKVHAGNVLRRWWAAPMRSRMGQCDRRCKNRQNRSQNYPFARFKDELRVTDVGLKNTSQACVGLTTKFTNCIEVKSPWNACQSF
jgi:hypothetical protein